MVNFADSLRQKLWGPNDVASLLEGIVGDSTNIHPATFSTWSPGYTCSGAMTYTTVTTVMSLYAKFGKICFIMIYANGTVGGTPSTDIIVSMPSGIVPDMGASNTAFPAFVYDTAQTHGQAIFSTTSLIIRKDASNWNAGASKYIGYNGFFRCT